MSLLTRADLVAESKDHPGQTYAERSIIRMSDSVSSMPPGAPNQVPAAEIATLQAFVDAGYPAEECSGVIDPFDAPPQCSSESYWQGEEGAQMDPGKACIACHKKEGEEEAPIFTLAGTVFPTAHEPDLCRAPAAQGAEIEIEDATKKLIVLKANSSGNFSYEGYITMPYTARVLSEGRVRAMATAQTDGDCNGCHTQDGAKDAPGRILLP